MLSASKAPYREAQAGSELSPYPLWRREENRAKTQGVKRKMSKPGEHESPAISTNKVAY